MSHPVPPVAAIGIMKGRKGAGYWGKELQQIPFRTSRVDGKKVTQKKPSEIPSRPTHL